MLCGRAADLLAQASASFPPSICHSLAYGSVPMSRESHALAHDVEQLGRRAWGGALGAAQLLVHTRVSGRGGGEVWMCSRVVVSLYSAFVCVFERVGCDSHVTKSVCANLECTQARGGREERQNSRQPEKARQLCWRSAPCARRTDFAARAVAAVRGVAQ
jgi:hypothetical protein